MLLQKVMLVHSVYEELGGRATESHRELFCDSLMMFVCRGASDRAVPTHCIPRCAAPLPNI